MDRLRQDGRTTLLAESSYRFEERETHGYRRFAEKNGFRIVNTEVIRVLDLPVADVLLGQLAGDAASHHADYRIETFTSDLPEQYLESYCEVHNQLATDAPSGDIDFEEESMTPEVFRQTEKRLEATGRTRLSTVAVTGEDRVVAYTDLVVKPDPSERVQQWGTLVDRRHRGHRLGTAVKVANLVALQQMFPDRSQVVTSNAEVNQNMVDINDRLGFEPVAVLPMFQRVL
jgi:RimJ/RimL family protein N-acetyltransferase